MSSKAPISQVLQNHTERLMSLPGVVGAAEGVADGEPCIRVFVIQTTDDLEDVIPPTLEGYRVIVQAAGEIRALGAPE